jgi:hypothetical protein
MAIIVQHEDYNEVSFFKQGDWIYKYKDIYIDENSFTRDFGNKKFHVINGEIVTTTVDKVAKFMTRIKKSRKDTK